MPASFMLTSGFVLLLIFLAFAGYALAVRRGRNADLLAGVQVLQAGKILLVHLQQHRGLSAAYLTGNEEVYPEIETLQEQISMDILQTSSLSHWLDTNEDWQGVSRHWASLSVKAFTISSEGSFDQHSRLIASLLSILDDVAIRYGLYSNSRFADVRLVWQEFLTIGELIGQVRALGVEILNSGGNHGRGKQIATVKKNMGKIQDLLNHSACRRILDSNQKESLAVFLSYVDSQVVEGRGPVSAMEFFGTATGAMNLVIEQFECEMLKLHRQVTGR